MADSSPKTTNSTQNTTDNSIASQFENLKTDTQFKIRTICRQPLFFQKWKCIETSVTDYDDRDISKKKDAIFTLEQLEEKSLLYINPKRRHTYVRVDSKLNVGFMFNPDYISDYPVLHRLLGPAMYSITSRGIKDLKWYINGKEYTEYNYWKLMCSLFCEQLRMTLSMDEARYWIDAYQWLLPFPDRLNRAIKDLDDTEDESRTQLSEHVVWVIDELEYLPAETFWNYWERKSYDLSELLR